MPYEDSAQLHKLLVTCVDPVSGEVDLPYDTLLKWSAVIGKASYKHLLVKPRNHTRTLSGLSASDFDAFATQKRNALTADTESGTRVQPPIFWAS